MPMVLIFKFKVGAFLVPESEVFYEIISANGRLWHIRRQP